MQLSRIQFIAGMMPHNLDITITVIGMQLTRIQLIAGMIPQNLEIKYYLRFAILHACIS